MVSDRTLDLLLTPDGEAVLSQLAERETTPQDSLKVGAQLRKRYPGELVAAALAQHELRLKAAEKFTRTDRMYFTRDGLEQASSELVARHRAARVAAGSGPLADLCCGIGGDLVALAAKRQVVGVDHDGVHLRMAAMNAAAYEVETQVETIMADVRDIDLTSVHAVFVDPARRVRGRRMRLGDSEPPLSWCTSIADQVSEVGIKAAPGIDRGAVPSGWETEFIAIGRELKEAVLWSPELASATRTATILPDGYVLSTGSAEDEPVDLGEPGRYLIDPNPAVTRAGVVEELARLIGAWKIDSQIAFLSTDHAVETPFGRVLEVVESLPWNEKRVREALRGLDVGAVDIRRRGLAGDVDQIRRRLKLSGSDRVTLVMTRVADQPWCLITR